MKRKSSSRTKESGNRKPAGETTMDRRKFMTLTATAAAGISILPRHVLGGAKYVAPSDTITLAYIGNGTQGTREMLPMLEVPQIRITAICDPNRFAVGYRDWGINDLKNGIRRILKDDGWEPGGDGIIPGGRENAKAIVDAYYKNMRPELKYNGCMAYEDVHELLDKENVDAVKIMTPDHLHGVIALAAMKRNRHVLLHKPISNRLLEGKKVVDTAKNSNVVTHLIPWDSNLKFDLVLKWIDAGAIGTLTQVHNWTNRPVWPQYAQLPTDKPPIPDGFNWDLWLGPESYREYSPDYTNMVFRGWYDFGGGSMADMGHYSLWGVFDALKLTSPTTVIPNRSHICAFNGFVPYRIENDFSYPMASKVRFKFPANGSRPAVDLIWYDGGVRPEVPEELSSMGKDLEEEGMMFEGTDGKILCGFNGQHPEIISGKKKGEAEEKKAPSSKERDRMKEALSLFAESCMAGKQYPGSFRDAYNLTETINLYAVALRSNKVLEYDAANQKITNAPDANKYLARDYRSGWENI